MLISSLKNDCSLFSRLYVASQRQDGDLDEFFKHVNQACPPTLSKMGVLGSGTKSEFLHCLESLISVENVSAPTTYVIILDAAAIVNMLRPGNAKTFKDYADNILLPYIQSKLQNVSRLDVIWDVYRPDRLKAETRSKRGKGIRRRVEESSVIPKKNWQAFLRIDENKTELFCFLGLRLAKIETL